MSTLTFRSQGTLIIAMYDNVAYRVIPLKLAEQGTLSFEGRDSSIDHLVLKRAQAGYSDKKDEVLCFFGNVLTSERNKISDSWSKAFNEAWSNTCRGKKPW